MVNDSILVESALPFIPPDDRAVWVEVGMAIRDGLGDGGFDLWDTWSQSAESYNAADARSAWRSFKPGGGIGLGSLFHKAKGLGWPGVPGGEIDLVALAARKEEAAERGKQTEAKRRQEEAETARKAASLWEAGRLETPPYLTDRGLELTPSLRSITAAMAAKILSYKPSIGGEPLTGNLLLVPVKVSGRLTSCQLIDGQKRKFFLAGGALRGSFWATQRLPANKGAGTTILIAEGVCTALSATMATGHLAVAAMSCGNLSSVSLALQKAYPEARLIICSDKGNGEVDAQRAAVAAGALLVVPEIQETGTDFDDLRQAEGLDAVRRQIESAIRPSPVPGKKLATGIKLSSEIEEPERPLLFDEARIPEISPKLLPSWLGAFTGAVARNTQTPPAMAVLLALSAVATAVAKRFDVAPSDGSYSEPLNLWTVTALPPGSRKTAVVSAMTGPLVEWEKIEAERLAPEIRRVSAKRHALEKRREKLLKDSANAEEQERLAEILQKIERLEEEVPEELHAPRLWTGDTTPERLQSLLVDHGERMAVLTDEAGIFEIMAGLYSGGVANLDIFLQGHAGRAVRVDRQGRTAHLDAPSLTFGLAVQPDILAELTSGGKRRFRGNGTLARFLFAVPRSNIGSRDIRAVYQIPEGIAKDYRDGLFDLLSIPPQFSEGREIPRRLILTPEALDSWQAFAEMIERRQGENGDLEPIQDWTAKLPGAALRIAGSFHLVEHGSKPPTQIETATVKRAVDLCTLLIEHARAAFHMMESESATADAKAIFNWITEKRLCRFRKGVAYRHFKGRFTGKKDRFDKAIQELEDRSIITSAGKEKTKGRAATVYVVNPTLWDEKS